MVPLSDMEDNSAGNQTVYFKSRKKIYPMQSAGHADPGLDILVPHTSMTPGCTKKSETGDAEGSIRGDLPCISLLIFLYVLQGIPLGLSGSIPMLLQSRKVSYSDQAVFSLVSWPFSVKLLWAPLVDSIYVRWFGRRKTWLVPTQYVMGLFMLVLSTQIQSLLGDESSTSQTRDIGIVGLTAIFVLLNFLAATQDIAVDGWALTMLSRPNIGWASTCNSVGQTAGYFLGNVLFLALESPDFCNSYLRSVPQPGGMITFSGFLWFWGIIFFITTTLVAIFKKEHLDLEVDPEQGIVETYRILLSVMCLPSVVSYLVVLLTSKVAFAASDALTGLKLIEAGMPKEKLALFAVPMVPLQVVLPLMISKYTSGPRPMEIWLRAYPFRLLLGVLYCLIVYWAKLVQTSPGHFPWYFYAVTLTFYALHQVAVYSMFVACMAFHARISDPSIGGTYMTLLNTFANLGGTWSSTMALWVVDHLTWKSCSSGEDCSSKNLEKACTENGGICSTYTDGYYILTVVCTAIGVLWLRSRAGEVRRLGDLSEKSWKYKNQNICV